MSKQIIECVPNISEGRDTDKIRIISQIVEKIMDGFDIKRLQLDPFIEACRPYLIKAGFDPSEWYKLGHINAKFVVYFLLVYNFDTVKSPLC